MMREIWSVGLPQSNVSTLFSLTVWVKSDAPGDKLSAGVGGAVGAGGGGGGGGEELLLPMVA